MFTTYIYAVMSVLVVSLISLVGIFTLSFKAEAVTKNMYLFISLAVGALLGDAFIHLLPESFGDTDKTLGVSLLVILGIFIFFVLEKFLHWHHHGEDQNEDHIHPVGKLVLLSDGVHNFIDGIIIGASFLVSIPVGIATTLAVILHEIPQEIGDFAVLLHAGYTKKRALWLNFLSALLSVLGLILSLIIGIASAKFINILIPVAAGGFIYIALTDLIPELHKTKEARYSLLQFLSLVLGVALMVLLLVIE